MFLLRADGGLFLLRRAGSPIGNAGRLCIDVIEPTDLGAEWALTNGGPLDEPFGVLLTTLNAGLDFRLDERSCLVGGEIVRAGVRQIRFRQPNRANPRSVLFRPLEDGEVLR